MKNMLLIVAVALLLPSCAKSLQQQKADHLKCANKVVAEHNKKYQKLGPEKGQIAFFNDMCEFNKIPERDCMGAIIKAHVEGQLPGVNQHYTIEAIIKPKCGDFPGEDKKTKNK